MAANNTHYSFLLYPRADNHVQVVVMETRWYPHKGNASRQLKSHTVHRDNLERAVVSAALDVLALDERHRQEYER